MEFNFIIKKVNTPWCEREAKKLGGQEERRKKGERIGKELRKMSKTLTKKKVVKNLLKSVEKFFVLMPSYTKFSKLGTYVIRYKHYIIQTGTAPDLTEGRFYRHLRARRVRQWLCKKAKEDFQVNAVVKKQPNYIPFFFPVFLHSFYFVLE